MISLALNYCSVKKNCIFYLQNLDAFLCSLYRALLLNLVKEWPRPPSPFKGRMQLHKTFHILSLLPHVQKKRYFVHITFFNHRPESFWTKFVQEKNTMRIRMICRS